VVLVVGAAMVALVSLLATMGTGLSVASNVPSTTTPEASPVGQSGVEALTYRGPSLSPSELLLISLAAVAVWVATAVLLLGRRRPLSQGG